MPAIGSTGVEFTKVGDKLVANITTTHPIVNRKLAEHAIDALVYAMYALQKDGKITQIGLDLEGGADIGKIKCLVCDQPIKQKEEARELEMDAMNNTVGTKRRSASPPRERPGKEGVQMSEEEHYYHKSLASMGALPVHDALNSVIQKYAEEQRQVTMAIVEASEEYKRETDYEGIQRSRLDAPISATELAVPAQVNYPPPPTSKLFAQESKMGSSYSGIKRNGYATSTGGPPSTSTDYFRSLEMKFTSSGSGATGRMRPNTATMDRNSAYSRSNPLLASKGNKTKRPGSAAR